MQFSMTDDALPTLNKQTNESQAKIGSLVLQLSDAIAPLEGKFQGDAAVKFQEFQANSVQYANELDNAMASISEGQAGVQRSFDAGTDEMVANAQTTAGSADYATANFHGGA